MEKFDFSRFYEPPEEPSPIAKDWRGEDLFENEDVVVFCDDYILDDSSELADYMRAMGERITL